jgi:AcrR family transcriptional regulator
MHDSRNRPYHHGDLRRALIQTALDMLHEDRHWQFTLREVARRAGVSHAAPYKHFPDKAALLSELAMLGFDQLRDALLAKKPRKPGGVREELLAIMRAYIRFGADHPGLYKLMYSTEAGGAVPLSERALGAYSVLLDALTRGQKSGELRKRSLRGQAAACWAEVHGIAMLLIDGWFLPEQIGTHGIDNALSSVLEGLEA